MKSIKLEVLFVIFFSLCISWKANSQSTFYSFKIIEPGIYKITEEDAKNLGANSLLDIAIHGYPGMLPQTLKKEQLELQQIPCSIQDGGLYIFLEGPNIYHLNDTAGWGYQHHLFEDSLSYLLEVGGKTKTINEIQLGESQTSSNTLYQLRSYKGEENNILNSGRTWFSDAIYPQSSRTISVFEEATIQEKWKISGSLMVSSLAPSTLSVNLDDQKALEEDFGPIPNTTYGVKGIEKKFEFEYEPESNNLDRIRIGLQTTDLNASGYWDYLTVGIPFSTDHLNSGIYYNWDHSSFSIKNNPELNFWDVSDFFNPVQLIPTTRSTVQIDKLVIFNPIEATLITEFKPIDLIYQENSSSAELLIIAPRIFSFAAEKLKAHKHARGITTEIAFLEDVYNSFGYGNKDIVAIRNFIASKFHPTKTLKNVLLLGKGTFDNKGKLGGRPNLVPIYSSRNSLNPLTSFSSDDFYGLLEFDQGFWNESKEGDERMQIGVGRLPVINTKEALTVVDKIIAYESNPSPGFWKKDITFLVDDGDNNIHLRDAEIHSKFLKENTPDIHQTKLYLDSYEQSSEASQKSIPLRNSLEKTLDEGTLIVNYIGHGNETTLAEEEIFNISDLDNWAKQKNLALWVTATCEFGRHDSPFLRSAAEELLIADNKGAICLLSTGRPVFSSINFQINEAFIHEVFKSDDQGYQDLGTIFKKTKNESLNGPLNRNFSLLADPSMKLNYPELSVEVKSLSDTNGNELDSISAGQEIVLEAEIQDPLTSSTMTGFNGTYQIELRGEDSKMETYGDENPSFTYSNSEVILFKGEGQVKDGVLQTRFLLPISLADKKIISGLRIIASDEENNWEAFVSDHLKISGLSEVSPDLQGPDMELFLNGISPEGKTFPSTSLYAQINFEDIHGIDISGMIPEHKIFLEINGGDPIDLNDQYSALVNSFSKGKIEFLLTGLVEGPNEILISSWDNLGNQSSLKVSILVEGSERLTILNHKTYPNPTDEISNFVLEHNRPGENFLITISIFQSTGQAIFTDSFRSVKTPARINDLSWVFLQTRTKYPAKGTYIYKITLQSESDNSSAVASGQIVIK